MPAVFPPWCGASSEKCANMDIFLNQLIRFYLNNMTNLPLDFKQYAALPHNIETTDYCDVTALSVHPWHHPCFSKSSEQTASCRLLTSLAGLVVGWVEWLWLQLRHSCSVILCTESAWSTVAARNSQHWRNVKIRRVTPTPTAVVCRSPPYTFASVAISALMLWVAH